MTTLRRALDYYNSSSSHAKVGIVVCIQRPLFAYYSWYIYTSIGEVQVFSARQMTMLCGYIFVLRAGATLYYY